MGKTATQMAHERLAEFHQTGRDAPLVHELAGKHEKRNRH